MEKSIEMLEEGHGDEVSLNGSHELFGSLELYLRQIELTMSTARLPSMPLARKTCPQSRSYPNSISRLVPHSILFRLSPTPPPATTLYPFHLRHFFSPRPSSNILYHPSPNLLTATPLSFSKRTRFPS